MYRYNIVYYSYLICQLIIITRIIYIICIIFIYTSIIIYCNYSKLGFKVYNWEDFMVQLQKSYFKRNFSNC